MGAYYQAPMNWAPTAQPNWAPMYPMTHGQWAPMPQYGQHPLMQQAYPVPAGPYAEEVGGVVYFNQQPSYPQPQAYYPTNNVPYFQPSGYSGYEQESEYDPYAFYTPVQHIRPQYTKPHATRSSSIPIVTPEEPQKVILQRPRSQVETESKETKASAIETKVESVVRSIETTAAPAAPSGNGLTTKKNRISSRKQSKGKHGRNTSEYQNKTETKINESAEEIVPQLVVAPAPETRKVSGCWAAVRESNVHDSRTPVAQHGHMLHVLGAIDPDHYDERKYDTDPRDIAYAYLLIGERLWVNVLYRVASRAGLTDVLVQDLDQFSAQFKALEPAKQKSALKKICTAKELDFAVEMYKNRLRVAHPSHFSTDKNAKNLAMHFAYLYGYEEGSGFQHSKYYMRKMAEELQVYSALNNYQANKLSMEPLKGMRDPALPSNAVVNTALALLYIQDYVGVNGFWAKRHSVAHNQGTDAMYQAYVNKVFPTHPHRDFMLKLEKYTRKVVRHYRDEHQVDVDEKVQTDAEDETENKDAPELGTA